MLSTGEPCQEPNFRRLVDRPDRLRGRRWADRRRPDIRGPGISGSATDLGLVFAAFLVPRVAFLLVGGVWADRLPRRYVMIGSDLVRASSPAVGRWRPLFSGTHEMWPFVLAAAVSGAASAFFTPAIVGLIPQTITPGSAPGRQRLLGVSQWAARLGGPVIAGLAVAAGVIGPLFVLDAASFVFSAFMLYAADRRRPPDRLAPIIRRRLQGWLAAR